MALKTKNPFKNPRIWVLLDPRKGTANQALGLAERLGFKFRAVPVLFTVFSKLPNFIRRSSLIGIRNTSDLKQAPFPDVVISSGRRLAPAALWIKKKNPKTRLIHIMYPKGSALSRFSLVLVPSHDANVPKRDNIFIMDGTIHRVLPRRLAEEKKRWRPLFSRYPKPLTTVIIGGKNKNKDLSSDKLLPLIDHVNALPGTALVTTSRRTSKEIVTLLKTCLKKESFLYVPDENPTIENPFFGMIAVADRIIVTGDSISMISEAGIANAPLYIYAPENTAQAKHYRFHHMLYAKGYAQPLFSDAKKSKKLDAFPGILKEIKARKILPF